MKAVLLALTLGLTTSAFASTEYICVSVKDALEVVISGTDVILTDKNLDSKIYEADINVSHTSSGTLLGIGTDDFLVQILDNGKNVLPAVLMINDRNFTELKCVRN